MLDRESDVIADQGSVADTIGQGIADAITEAARGICQGDTVDIGTGGEPRPLQIVVTRGENSVTATIVFAPKHVREVIDMVWQQCYDTDTQFCVLAQDKTLGYSGAATDGAYEIAERYLVGANAETDAAKTFEPIEDADA